MADTKQKVVAATQEVTNGLVEVIVANGRTLVADHPTEKRSVPDGNGSLRVFPALVSYRPGDLAQVPAEDVAWLRSTGVVLREGEAFLPRFTSAGVSPGAPGFVTGMRG